jgi:hypothetical protein
MAVPACRFASPIALVPVTPACEKTMTTQNAVSAVTFVCDEESVQRIPFTVSESLADKLWDQSKRLIDIDPSRPGKERYQLARAAGCFAAVAKGVKDRKLEQLRLYIPGTEVVVTGGHARISALKATLPVADGLRVRGVVFLNTDGEGSRWSGHLEVVPQAA